uniref:EGF-like domain-containing protein n=2 Tax=Magallana gigas TaxID=29159 RepID=A0A8W8LN99_MAGGI|nr:cell death abnormality protein 1-like [Crassostrea gigas]
MEGLRLFLLFAVLCVQAKYSLAFKTCSGNGECPDNAKCDAGNCKCDAGFDLLDLPYTAASNAVPACRDLGVCSETDNSNTDCGPNGHCITYVDDYEAVKTVCKCKPGYYGVNCDKTTPVYTTPTTSRPYVTTTRKTVNFGAIIPAIGGGILLLALLAGGAAALTSSSG